MASFDTDVLVVGSGPTGLVTALTLAKNGVPVRIIDKSPQHLRGQRGAGIMPRTLEIYHFLGVLDEIEASGLPSMHFKEYENGKPTKIYSIMPEIEPTPAYPQVEICYLGQDAACAILRSHLSAYGIEVELATELIGFTEDQEFVASHIVRRQDTNELEETIKAKYLVGADGARGIVRKLLKTSFLGETRDSAQMIVGDVEVHGVDPEYWHKFGDSPNDIVLLRPTNRTATENIFFIFASGPNLDHSKAVEDPECLRQFVYHLAKIPELKIGRMENVTNYRPNIRIADRFNKDRVFIAGDAAHVHSPMGGQGMNSSVMDAFNLSWKLALASKGLSAPGLLDSYAAERLPVIQEMLQRTTFLLNRTLALSDGESAGAPPASEDNPKLPWQRPAQLNQLGVHYRWSSIVVDEAVDELGKHDKEEADTVTASTYVVKEGGPLHAGDRAPDAPGLVDLKTGSKNRLFDIFGPDHHTVLVFSDGEDEVAETLRLLGRYPAGLMRSAVIRSQHATVSETTASADLVLQDKEGHAFIAYGATRVAIVRPDGVVGALAGSAEGVKKYFGGVLAF